MSWQQLLDIRKQTRAEAAYYADRPPVACPRCGEPLRQAPASAENTLYCKFDGWSYPRDWIRPETP